jgi:tetratricopeptide (TPR) repeat protein
MLGKITGALIRKEADAYRAQGLYEEALALFKKSLDSSPPLPSDVKKAISQQIKQLEAEMVCDVIDEHDQLSDEQVAVIRQGWNDDASVEDLAVSAHALHAMGCYTNALDEFVTLIRRGYSPHHVIAPMAKCLAQLNPPQELADAVDRLAAELFQDFKNRFAFKLSLAEEMIKNQFIDHAFGLRRDLALHSDIPLAYLVRLETLDKNLKSLNRRVTPELRNKGLSDSAGSESPSVFHRVHGRLKALIGGLRSPKSRP